MGGNIVHCIGHNAHGMGRRISTEMHAYNWINENAEDVEPAFDQYIFEHIQGLLKNEQKQKH